MALNTVLLLAAGMGMNMGFQDPAFDMQFAVPVLDQTQPVVDLTVQGSGQSGGGTIALAPTTPATVVYELAQAAPSQGKKVTAQFKNAKVSEVLSWLQEQGVSFVVANGIIPDNATVTLNVVDQPADDVIEAIASSLGGHWARERGIRVFKRGKRPFGYASGLGGGAFGGMKALEPMKAEQLAKNFQWNDKEFAKSFPKFDKEFAQNFKWSEKDFEKQFGPDFQKKMEAMAKDMSAMKMDQKEFAKQFGPDFHKKMEAMAKDGKAYKMDEKEFAKHFGPDFQKKMEGMAKEFSGKFGPDWEKDMQKRFGPEFEKKMLERSKEMEKMGKDMEIRMRDLDKQHKELFEKARKEGGGAYQLKDGKLFKIEPGQTLKVDGKDITILRDQVSRDRAVLRARDARSRNDLLKTYTTRVKGGDKVTIGRGVDAKKFLDSLTPDQKHSQRMRGYILYIDLTKEQREMLGDQPKGKFEIKMKVNDQEVAVRGS